MLGRYRTPPDWPTEGIEMALPENIDQEKLSEAALAILSLSAWDEEHGARAWKNMDWPVGIMCST